MQFGRRKELLEPPHLHSVSGLATSRLLEYSAFAPSSRSWTLSLCSIETLLAFLKCLICGSSFCWLLIVRRSRVLFLVGVATSDLELVFQSRILRSQFRSLCSIPGFLHCSLVLCTSASMQVIDSDVVSYTAALCRFYSQRLTHRIVSCHFVSTITPPGKEGDSAQHVLSCE